MMTAVALLPTNLFAQSDPPAPLTTSACPSGLGFITAVVAGEKAHVPQLERPSLVEAEATMVQVAKRVMNDPHLFAFEVMFNDSFLQLGPDNSGITTSAYYESPCDQLQYLGISRWLNLKNFPEDSAQLGKAPFLPPYSCWGNKPAQYIEPPPSPEPGAKHPPVEGWTVDLPRLWNVAKGHQALFANGLERCTITTTARLREVDNKPQCGSSTIFDSAEWQGGAPSGKPARRLVNEQGQRAVIELLERGLAKPHSGSGGNPCAKGHYLIIDARSGADLESGTYFFCISPPA